MRIQFHTNCFRIANYQYVAIPVLCLVFLLAGRVTPVAGQSTPMATGKNAIGTLLVVRTDGIEERLQGEGSLRIFDGDILKTESQGQGLIVFADGIQVALNENTSLKIVSRWEKANGRTPILKINQGEVWIKTGAGPKPMEVETPVAVAATREAELDLKVAPDGQSVLTTINGLVEFGTAFGTCPIRTGSISYGERGKRCTKPAPTDSKAAIAWTSSVVR